MADKFEHLVDDDVRDILKTKVSRLWKQNMLPPSLEKSLKQASKSGTGAGKPDFAITYDQPEIDDLAVIIEDKYGLKFLELTKKDGSLSTTVKAINDYAVNGALHYAQAILKSEENAFKEVIAIGIAGELDNKDIIKEGKGYYYFSPDHDPKPIDMKLDVLLSRLADDEILDLYQDISLTDKEKSAILAQSYNSLKKTSKDLNRIFYDYSFPVDERVVIVSGMLLAMEGGVTPDRLVGHRPGSAMADGAQIYSGITTALSNRDMPQEKYDMMVSTFATIKADRDRDVKRDGVFRTGSRKGKPIPNESINKEIFDFLYYNVYKMIDRSAHLDSLGEMYSSFLKYALGDGKENGIVLTPPYVTKLMCELIDVDRNDKILDPCTGSAGFLVTAMTHMLEDMHENEPSDNWEEKTREIKKEQLCGVEFDRKMFSLAATNMILRGDGSSKIIKSDFFEAVHNGVLKDFGATKCLLNPPFSYSENGMPFVLGCLNSMVKGGKLAVIIQDSAGTGKSIETNKKILKDHSLEASIRMPGDLFEPSAGVQTSIYIFTAGVPHDVKKNVRFIDFADDGYKRTGRGMRKIGDPDTRYEDVKNIFKYGDNAETTHDDIDVVDDVITLSGDDWNYTQHMVIDTVPTEEDFMKTVGDYMSFELSMVLSGKGHLIGLEDIDE